MTEKSEFREMSSFDLAIRRAYFKAQIRRNYAKNVVINRSALPQEPWNCDLLKATMNGDWAEDRTWDL